MPIYAIDIEQWTLQKSVNPLELRKKVLYPGSVTIAPCVSRREESLAIRPRSGGGCTFLQSAYTHYTEMRVGPCIREQQVIGMSPVLPRSVRTAREKALVRPRNLIYKVNDESIPFPFLPM